ncbi:MAG: phosphodiesterase [Clostridia bacterium]|nr:phosphodiesterase [Clostridia bacterium]
MSKFLIASDIHGSAEYCKRLLTAFELENAEKLLLLGDILYHGPRNPLPAGYAPKEVAEMLGGIKEKIICVRGNCDSEVDQMVLPFPVTSDYAAVFADGLTIYLSHGHRQVPPLMKGDVYLTGHTHVPIIEKGEYLHLNPGSVSLPKEGSAHGYILYENKTFYFKTLDGKIYDEIEA